MRTWQVVVGLQDGRAYATVHSHVQLERFTYRVGVSQVSCRPWQYERTEAAAVRFEYTREEWISIVAWGGFCFVIDVTKS